MKINIVLIIHLFWHLQECKVLRQKCHLEPGALSDIEKAARYRCYHRPQHAVMKPHFMPLSK